MCLTNTTKLLMMLLISMARTEAKELPAIIANTGVKPVHHIDYINDIFLEHKEEDIKIGDVSRINFTENSIIPLTVFIPTNKYVGLSVAVMPGDTVQVAYNALEDTYEFTSRHPAELALYKQLGESKFSARNWTMPVYYNSKRPFEEYIRDWRALWVESEQRLAKITAVPGIRLAIKEHFIFEARLRLLQILLQPLNAQFDAATARPIPKSYQDTVFAYEKKIIFTKHRANSPSLAFAYRGHAAVIAEREGNLGTQAIQYKIAKREFTGYEREWTCYSALKDMFTFNKDVEQLPALLKDYQTWASPNSPFVKKIVELTKLNNTDILSENALNDDLNTVDDKVTRLFDIINKYKGQVIYIDLWASWCGPCLAELPASAELRKHYDLQELAVLYLSLDKDNAKWLSASAKLLADTSNSYCFRDRDKAGLLKKFGVSVIPHYLLLDKKGMVRYSNAPRPNDPTLHKLIDSLL